MKLDNQTTLRNTKPMKKRTLITATACYLIALSLPLLGAEQETKMTMSEMMKDKDMMRQMCADMAKDPAMTKMMCQEMMKNPDAMKTMCDEMMKNPKAKKMCMDMMK